MAGSGSPDRPHAPEQSSALGLDFAGAVEASPFGIVLTDNTQPDNPIVFANAAFAELTGYGSQEIVGQNCRFLQGKDTNRQVVAEIAEAVRRGGSIRRELLNYRKDGQPFWNEISIQPRLDKSSGRVVSFVGTQIDVTDRHRAQEDKEELEARLTSLVENLPGYIFQRIRDPDGSFSFSYFSPSFWRLLGFEEIPPLHSFDAFKYIDPRDVENVRNAVLRSLLDFAAATIEFRAIAADGKERWLRTHSTPRKLDDGSVVWDGVGIDVTAEKTLHQALTYLAYHDPLTGLCNRVLFARSLEEAIGAGTAGQSRIAAFLLDLDGFQEVNDSLGSSVGDAALRCVAERVAAFAGSSGIAARLGGDEFGVFRTNITSAAAIIDDARSLSRVLNAPMHIKGHEITVETCVGATEYPFLDRKATDRTKASAAYVADEIVNRANLALAEAKRAGRSVIRLYVPELDDRKRSRVILRQTLQRAVVEQQFLLHYHPLVDLGSGRILGAEALVRWAHPDLGLQPPDLFIPLAETSGLIIPLGKWVLRTAMHELRKWEQYGASAARIAVNISSVQLRDPDFIAMVDDVLAETSGNPRQIDLELTETVLIEASTRTLGILNALKARGFRLALDDFGTGYSSFQYLRALPIDEVKIDQTFVRRLVVDSSDASIIRAILTVAKSLGLGVIAEGIETVIQRDFLRDEGCGIGQGYLFSLPLAAEDFRRLLDQRATLPSRQEHDSSRPAFRGKHVTDTPIAS